MSKASMTSQYISILVITQVIPWCELVVTDPNRVKPRCQQTGPVPIVPHHKICCSTWTSVPPPHHMPMKLTMNVEEMTT